MKLFLRGLFLLLALGSAAVAGTVSSRPFDLHRDVFSFSNDTFFAYGVDEAGQLHITRREKPVPFAHSCFLLTRGVLQFRHFARFDPRLPKISREEYRQRVREIFRIPVWWPAPIEPVVIPGFPDLYSFSRAYEGLLKENFGSWRLTYLRSGNWRMTMGHLRIGQAAAHRWLQKSLAEGRLRALYLASFPHMNHVVVVYDSKLLPNGNTRYLVYDPNYPAEPSWVDYVPAERSFNFQKRWYFPGGRVNVMRVYISPFH